MLVTERLRDMVNFPLVNLGTGLIVRNTGFIYGIAMTRYLLGAALLLCSALPALAGGQALSLAPVPYALDLPDAITSRLSTGELAGPFAGEVKQAGAVASTLVFYQPEKGDKTVLMAVYYFPAGKFDAAKNPDEPPRFGDEVIRKDGMVLSIAGPHDTIYEPDTPDGKNVIEAAGMIYAPQSYRPQ